jgi:hypothetical protein
MARPEIPIMESGFRYCNPRTDPEEKTRAADREVGTLVESTNYI